MHRSGDSRRGRRARGSGTGPARAIRPTPSACARSPPTTSSSSTSPRGSKVIGETDFTSGPSTLHPKAIYIVEGRLFQVESLDFEGRKAYVRARRLRLLHDGHLLLEGHRARHRRRTRGAVAPPRRRARVVARRRLQEDQVLHQRERRLGRARSARAADAHHRLLAGGAARPMQALPCVEGRQARRRGRPGLRDEARGHAAADVRRPRRRAVGQRDGAEARPGPPRAAPVPEPPATSRASTSTTRSRAASASRRRSSGCTTICCAHARAHRRLRLRPRLSDAASARSGETGPRAKTVALRLLDQLTRRATPRRRSHRAAALAGAHPRTCRSDGDQPLPIACAPWSAAQAALRSIRRRRAPSHGAAIRAAGGCGVDACESASAPRASRVPRPATPGRAPTSWAASGSSAPKGLCIVVDRYYARRPTHGRQRIGEIVDTLAGGRRGAAPRLGARAGRRPSAARVRVHGCASSISRPPAWPAAPARRRSSSAARVIDGDGVPRPAVPVAGLRARARAAGTLVARVDAATRARSSRFNGRTFDLPLLEMRFSFIGSPWPWARCRISTCCIRRGVSGRIGRRSPGPPLDEASCSLARARSGSRRRAPRRRRARLRDPGALLPVRARRPREPLEAVLEHNRLDLLSPRSSRRARSRLIERGPAPPASAGESRAWAAVYERCRRQPENAEACFAQRGVARAHASARAGRAGGGAAPAGVVPPAGRPLRGGRCRVAGTAADARLSVDCCGARRGKRWPSITSIASRDLADGADAGAGCARREPAATWRAQAEYRLDRTRTQAGAAPTTPLPIEMRTRGEYRARRRTIADRCCCTSA